MQTSTIAPNLSDKTASNLMDDLLSKNVHIWTFEDERKVFLRELCARIKEKSPLWLFETLNSKSDKNKIPILFNDEEDCIFKNSIADILTMRPSSFRMYQYEHLAEMSAGKHFNFTDTGARTLPAYVQNAISDESNLIFNQFGISVISHPSYEGKIRRYYGASLALGFTSI